MEDTKRKYMDVNLIKSARNKIIIPGILSLLVLALTSGLNYSISNNQDMTTLKIDFQEGFTNDSVECQLNGNIIYKSNNCNTKLLVGLADSVDVSLKKGSNTLKIVIKNRGIKKEIPIRGNEDMFVGISIVNDTIEHIISSKPFGYG